MKNSRPLRLLLSVTLAAVILLGLYGLYYFNYIPHKKYPGEHFGISPYSSRNDQDHDGVDDQTDILHSVRDYIATRPKYKSRYYTTGYPNDGYGVCTDVVAFGLLGAGYDLMELLYADVTENPERYPTVETPDKCIDFRRVRNLDVFFAHHALSLTTDIRQIDEWQGGDIVVFKGHIGIISDKRNRKGFPFVIHHAGPYQLHYEEDILERREDIIGHYRMG